MKKWNAFAGLCAVAVTLSGCSGSLISAGPQPIYLGYSLTNRPNVLDSNVTRFYARPSGDKAALVQSGRITSPVQVTLDREVNVALDTSAKQGDVYNDYPVQVCAGLPHLTYVTFKYEFFDQQGQVVDTGSQSVYIGDCQPGTVNESPSL